ncbi:hypothetical protein AWM70_12550 [Paenibacillus yonginensis]|uniref:Protein kinase domain-containing protein n=2 Tax=Paenibacillus yonginensis TaxID=1462996 RepID=A0A1B1N1L7_9BACL|nr:hypothetical protein AWM70_12550 [Paenibacillus yonginensis]
MESSYELAEHPLVSGIPYGQEGRQGTVYKLIRTEDGLPFALKVFRPSYRDPALVKKAAELNRYAELEGLKAASREVIDPQNSKELLSRYPELLYAAVMPWIEGSTWNEIISQKQVLSVHECMDNAAALAETLTKMEEHGLAHTDLSSSNLMLSTTSDGMNIQLIDLEDLYAGGASEPDELPAGGDGYKSPSIQLESAWGAQVDRFPGGLLLAELLAWADPDIRESSFGDSYFAPNEIQQSCERYERMVRTLLSLYGPGMAGLFERVWSAEQLQQCPSFAEWSLALMAAQRQLDESLQSLQEEGEQEEKGQQQQETADLLEEGHSYEEVSVSMGEQEEDLPWESAERFPDEEVRNKLDKARELERLGKWPSALWEYGRLIEYFPKRSSLRREIEMVMDAIQDKLDSSEGEAIQGGVVQQIQRQAATFQEESAYRKLWMILSAAAGVILVVAVVVYLL